MSIAHLLNQVHHAELTDLQAGKAGEYLVCADLILQGYVAFPSEQGLPFDVVCNANDRLLKLQVKTTRCLMAIPQRRNGQSAYLFHVKRMGKNGLKHYGLMDVDIFALVALDSRKIAYLPATAIKTTMQFRIRDEAIKYRGDDKDIKESKIRDLRISGATYSEISESLGIDRSYAHRVVSGKETINRVPGRYIDEFPFHEALKELER